MEETRNNITIQEVSAIYLEDRTVIIETKYFDKLKLLMLERVGDFAAVVKNHVEHYGITKGLNDGSKFMVRKGEIGETAHMLFSWLTCYIVRKGSVSYQIYLQQENEGGNASLADLQEDTIIASFSDYITVVKPDISEEITIKMEAYNNGPLAIMCKAGMRSKVRNLLLGEEFPINDFVQEHIIPAVNRILDEARGAHPIVIWYKKPKNEEDIGRMNSIYRVLEALDCQHIIWMGDAPDEHAKCTVRGPYYNFDPLKKRIPRNIQCTFVTTAQMSEEIKNSLLYQWILCATVTNRLQSVMVCPARTGGSHGPYLLGTPLVYFDVFDGNVSFLQERMAIHALIDNLLTPVPFGAGDIEESQDMMLNAIARYLALQQNGDEDIFLI